MVTGPLIRGHCGGPGQSKTPLGSGLPSYTVWGANLTILVNSVLN